jgi:hypothetical protein
MGYLIDCIDVVPSIPRVRYPMYNDVYNDGRNFALKLIPRLGISCSS